MKTTLKSQYCNTTLMEVTTVLIIHNEEENLEPLILDIVEMYNERNIDGELLLVDDGSSDGSGKICDYFADKFSNVKVKHHLLNHGISYAMNTGFRYSEGDVVILMDADRQFEAEEIPKFIKEIENGSDVVSGMRLDRADKMMRRIASNIFNLIVRKRFKFEVRDNNSGFKAFKKEVLESIDFNLREYDEPYRLLLLSAFLKDYSIKEIPVRHYPRYTGESHIKLSKAIFQSLRDLKMFKRRHQKRLGELRRRMREEKRGARERKKVDKIEEEERGAGEGKVFKEVDSKS